MIRQLLTVFSILIIVSCQQSKAPTENEQKDIVESVQKTLDNYYSDIKKSGLTAEFNYLDNSEDFFWVPPGYDGPISYDSVATILRKNAPLYKSVDNSFETLQIIPLNNELATYTGQLRSVMIDTSGKVMTFSLVETGVVIKRSNGWKLLHGQTSIINQ